MFASFLHILSQTEMPTTNMCYNSLLWMYTLNGFLPSFIKNLVLRAYCTGNQAMKTKRQHSVGVNPAVNNILYTIILFSQIVGFGCSEREMIYVTTHSTHFIYGYMASDTWLRTILRVRKETRCRHIGYSYRVLLYAPSHRQDNTYHGLCYTSRGALAGTRNSSMGPPHKGSIRRPTAP